MSKPKWTLEYAKELPWLRRSEASRVMANDYDAVGGEGEFSLIQVDDVCDRWKAKKKPAWMCDLQQFKGKELDELIEFLVEHQKVIPEDVVFVLWIDFEIMFRGSCEEVIGRLFDCDAATVYKVFGIDTWGRCAMGQMVWRSGEPVVEFHLSDITRKEV